MKEVYRYESGDFTFEFRRDSVTITDGLSTVTVPHVNWNEVQIMVEREKQREGEDNAENKKDDISAKLRELDRLNGLHGGEL